MTSVSQSLFVRNFLLPKRGHKAEECEDAIAMNSRRTRFAVADGATEAFDSGNWARRLVSSWTENNGLLQADEFLAWLKNQGEEHCEAWTNVELSWYASEKERAGSFAAFVGVELHQTPESHCWNAIAIGDSCLIHTHGNDIIHTFPLTKSEDFGPAPVLAPSRAPLLTLTAKEVRAISGRLGVGDQLLVLSDATAAWFLRLHEERDDESRTTFINLLKSESDSALVEFLEQERSGGRLKNDDVAIIRIAI